MSKPRDGILDLMYDPKKRRTAHWCFVLTLWILGALGLLSAAGIYLLRRLPFQPPAAMRFAALADEVASLSCVADSSVVGRLFLAAAEEDGFRLSGELVRLPPRQRYGLAILDSSSSPLLEGMATVYNPTREGGCREWGDLVSVIV